MRNINRRKTPIFFIRKKIFSPFINWRWKYGNKRNVIKEHKQLSKEEGSFLSDIGYIKACVDRMEKKISNVDERYQDLLQRLTKVEENLINTQKRVEEIIISEYG